MTIQEHIPLAPLTTLGVGGAARFFIEAQTEEDVRGAIILARERALPLFVLGNGSNLLVPDAGVAGVVVKMAMQNISLQDTGDHLTIVADAGARWDTVVDAAGEQGIFGIENLAGIPGTVGGAAVQNIGAYGGELSRAFNYADCIDAATGATIRVTPSLAAFAYRTSIFKQKPGYIIVRVALRLAKDTEPNLTYADVARARAAGTPLATPREIASAIRSIRAKKFPSATDGGTAGSFFKNPAVPQAAADALRARFPELPTFPQKDGTVKIALAWVLDHVLSLKGHARGRVRLFENQPLVIVAQVGATASDVDALAREVENRVYTSIRISIEREVETFGAMRA